MFLFQTTLTPRWMQTQLHVAANLMKGVGGIIRRPLLATVSSGFCSVPTQTQQSYSLISDLAPRRSQTRRPVQGDHLRALKSREFTVLHGITFTES